MRRITGFGSIDWRLGLEYTKGSGEESRHPSVQLLFKPDEPLPPFGPASLGQDDVKSRVGEFPEQLLRFRRLLSLVKTNRIWFQQVPDGVIVDLYIDGGVRDSGKLLSNIARRLRR